MEMLKLAMKSGLPLIYVRTDDIINVEEVLTFLAGEDCKPLAVPEVINKIAELKVPAGRLHFTSSECKSLVKLYHFCVEHEKTIVFVNTEKSVLQFDGGQLVPPKELVQKYLMEFAADEASAVALLPSFGGLTLKDVGEVAKMTMTRDEGIDQRGVNETRRGYKNLKGIQQVSTEMLYYIEPSYLSEWLNTNTKFFLNPMHPSLIPRGLLFDGPPGTGKTMAAKAIAHRFGIPLYRLDIGAMKGKYVGDSEGNLLAALASVDQVEPCVVIFDEVEKIFQSQGDSGVTTSMLSQLLWWLQEHSGRIFTVMTTNDREKIPSELYREGRIDGIMDFQGIEGVADGYEFAKGAFDSMLIEVGQEAEPAAYKELNKRVKTLFADATCVPQAKLTQNTYTFVRELLAQTGEEE